MPVRFAITTLKPGVDPADYEAWVYARDYALVDKLPNFVSYKVHRIQGPITGFAESPGWSYLERIEVKSLAQHDADLKSPEGVALLDELYGRYLDRTKTVYFATELV